MPTFTYILDNEDATRALGEDLALTVRPGDCLALRGDLGAGKSALSRALIRAVACADELEVPSPTFTLVQSYELRHPIFHFDLYRLADESELAELGLDEALNRGVVLIESLTYVTPPRSPSVCSRCGNGRKSKAALANARASSPSASIAVSAAARFPRLWRPGSGRPSATASGRIVLTRIMLIPPDRSS